MRIAFLQFDIVWAAPDENIIRAEKLIDRHPGADLYVLPEMFTTGFATQPEGIAESDNCKSLQWMKSIAKTTHAAIAGSIAVKSDERYFNRLYFVKPDGETVTYDKRHLFTYSGEDRQYTGGDERIIVEYMGIRFLLQICYDLRFPVWSRNTGDYDVALYVANWPVKRIAVWDILLRARAIENQCYVVGVNRIGKDLSCRYNGHSAAVSPYGEVIVACQPDTEDIQSFETDMAALHAFRKKFPVLTDADRFLIKES